MAPDQFSIGLSNPGATIALTPVRGLGELEADIIQETDGEKKRKNNLEKVSYTDIEVLRGSQSLGNLYDLRQAYHLWQDQVEVCAVNTQQFNLVPWPRCQRTPRASNMIFRDGVLMEVAKDGSLTPAQDPFIFRSAVFESRGEENAPQGFKVSRGDLTYALKWRDG